MAPVFGRGRGRRCSVEVGVRRASVGAEARQRPIPSLQRLFDRLGLEFVAAQ
jgi:hypothetical protein